MNFKELYINGKTTFDTINDFIGDWHDSESLQPLHEFLGLTEKDYAAWIENEDDTLIKILDNYKGNGKNPKMEREEPVFHELTCGNDSRHSSLKSKILNNEVILEWVNLDYTQAHIPEFFFSNDFEEFYNRRLEFLNNISQKQIS